MNRSHSFNLVDVRDSFRPRKSVYNYSRRVSSCKGQVMLLIQSNSHQSNSIVFKEQDVNFETNNWHWDKSLSLFKVYWTFTKNLNFYTMLTQLRIFMKK